jgi:predicted metal-dependent phosphoesterase TrpH
LKGLDGLAITDHHTLQGAEEATRVSEGPLVIKGEEVSTSDGEILALGIEKRIPKNLPTLEAIGRVHAQSGIVIVPHPTVPFFGRFKESDLQRMPVDGLEVFSSITPLTRHFTKRNLEIARRIGLPALAGSDSHFAETVGDAYTLVDSEDRSEDGVLQAIRRGRVGIGCRPSALRFKIRMLNPAPTIMTFRRNRDSNL